MRNNLSLDQVFSDLSWVSYERKMAIAFALYSDTPLTKVINLKWSDTLDLNWRSSFILERVPESDQIDYVFWEKQGNRDVTLTLLPCIFGIATMWQDWDVFVARNWLAIPIEFNKIGI